MGNKDYKPWKNYENKQRTLDYQIKNTKDSITGYRERYDHAKTLEKTHPMRRDNADYERAIANSKKQLKLLKSIRDANTKVEFANHKTMIEKDHFISKYGDPKSKRLARHYIKNRQHETAENVLKEMK